MARTTPDAGASTPDRTPLSRSEGLGRPAPPKPADPSPVIPVADDGSVPSDTDTRSVEERHDDRIREARETLGLDPDTGKPVPPPAASKISPPVYDERGNVRPRGTPGARTMTYAERVEIAKRLAAGDEIVTTAERVPAK